MRNNNKGTIAFTTKFSYFIVVLPLKGVHYNKTHLLIWVTFGFLNIFEMRKTILLKNLRDFSVLDQWFSENVASKLTGKVYLGKYLLVLPS